MLLHTYNKPHKPCFSKYDTSVVDFPFHIANQKRIGAEFGQGMERLPTDLSGLQPQPLKPVS